MADLKALIDEKEQLEKEINALQENPSPQNVEALNKKFERHYRVVTEINNLEAKQ